MTQTVVFHRSAALVQDPTQPVAFFTGGTAGGGSVDLRTIIANHVYQWLDELSDAHAAIIESAANHSRDVWLSGVSRLDARPWGQAALIKPLFFARAIIFWLKNNPAAPSLVVVGAPSDTVRHLAVLAPELRIQAPRDADGNRLSRSVRFLRLIIWAGREMTALYRHHHGPRRAPGAPGDTLLLAQPVRGQPYQDAYKYFFTTLMDEDIQSRVSVAVIGIIDREQRIAHPAATDPEASCLFDGISLGLTVKAFFSAVAQAFMIRRRIKRHGSRLRGHAHTPLFWHRFAHQLVDPGELFHGLIVRDRLTRLIRIRGYRKILFPYEEKGLERAIIQACAAHQATTLGYLPHPQHRLLTALQDRPGSTCPKPDGYAFCGEAYVDFFKSWAGKTSAPMIVWGSGKGVDKGTAHYSSTTYRRSVVLALSHPEELDLLRIWLGNCPALTEHVDLTLRPYPAADPVLFRQALDDIRQTHPNLTVSTGSLESDIQHHDAVAFCATSAGLEAVMMGAVALFVDLTDGFPINPCFDDTSAFRPSFTEIEFADNLAWLARADETALDDLRAHQVTATSRIFGPPDKAAVLQSVR